MFKKLTFISFLISTFFIGLYPTKKENIKIFDYCFALEIIITENSIQTKKNLSGKFKTISIDILNLGISETRGNLINNIIDQYKKSRNSLIIKFIPNNILCLGGYYIERIKPGTFESIFFEESKKTINEFKEFKDEVDGILNNINSEYKTIRKEFNSLF